DLTAATLPRGRAGLASPRLCPRRGPDPPPGLRGRVTVDAPPGHVVARLEGARPLLVAHRADNGAAAAVAATVTPRLPCPGGRLTHDRPEGVGTLLEE